MKNPNKDNVVPMDKANKSSGDLPIEDASTLPELTNVAVLDEAVYDEVAAMCQQANSGFYAALLAKYSNSAAEDVENLKVSIANDDAGIVKASAHRLKSSSANWGGLRVSAVCLLLENAGKSGDLAHAPKLLELLTAEVDLLISELQQRQSDAA